VKLLVSCVVCAPSPIHALPNTFRIHQYQCRKSKLFLTIGSPSIFRVTYTHTHTHTHTHTQRVTLDANRHARTHVCIMRGRLHRIMRGRRCSLSAREHAVRSCVCLERRWWVCLECSEMMCVSWTQWDDVGVLNADDVCVLNAALMHVREDAALCMPWPREPPLPSLPLCMACPHAIETCHQRRASLCRSKNNASFSFFYF